MVIFGLLPVRARYIPAHKNHRSTKKPTKSAIWVHDAPKIIIEAKLLERMSVMMRAKKPI
jgi:hypothetical protein